MQHNEIFTSIELSNGSRCDILEINALVIWKAAFRHQAYPDKELDIVPFLLEQVLIIDDKKRDIEFIGNISIDDYLKIMEVMDIVMKKLPKF